MNCALILHLRFPVAIMTMTFRIFFFLILFICPFWIYSSILMIITQLLYPVLRLLFSLVNSYCWSWVQNIFLRIYHGFGIQHVFTLPLDFIAKRKIVGYDCRYTSLQIRSHKLDVIIVYPLFRNIFGQGHSLQWSYLQAFLPCYFFA